MQVWWEKILQQHSCHNSSQQGARIGDLHHLSDSSRLMTPLTSDNHHHINTRCIDFENFVPRPAQSVHPAARAGTLKHFIQPWRCSDCSASAFCKDWPGSPYPLKIGILRRPSYCCKDRLSFMRSRVESTVGAPIPLVPLLYAACVTPTCSCARKYE